MGSLSLVRRGRVFALVAAGTAVVLGCNAELKSGIGPDPTKAIASITILPGQITIGVGTTISFVYYGTTVGGDSVRPPLDWTANGGVLGPDGEFTGSAVGTFQVIGETHAAPHVGDTVTVTVTNQAITDSVVIVPSIVTVLPGASQTFAAQAYQSDGSIVPAPVTWNAGGGTITAGGTFTAGATLGTYRVDATNPTNGGLLDTAVVFVASSPATLQTISLTPVTATIPAGGTAQFQAQGNFSDGSQQPVPVTYTAAAGSINPAGLYTAPQTAGTYRVIATHASGKADTSNVTVTGTLAQVVLTPPTVALQFGGTQQFSVIGQFTDGSSSPISVQFSATGGSISGGGFYTAGNTAGTFRVIAAHSSGKSDTSTVTVQAPPATVVGLNLLPATASLLTGGTKQFTAQDVYSNGATTGTTNVNYTASAGTITGGGLYTAPGVAGTYRVIATSTLYGFKDTTNVVVSAPASLVQVIISPTSPTIGVGGVIPFVANGRLSDGTTSTVQVNWSVSGGGTINGSGLFTAGNTPGQYQVRAQVIGGTLADTTDVFVSATPPSVFNEPAGYVPFAIHRLNEIPVFGRAVGGVLGAWYAYPQGNPNLTLGTDPTALESPDSIIRTKYPTGQNGGTGPVDWGGWDAKGSGSAGQKSQIYIRMVVKIEGTSFENQASGTKVGFLAVGRDAGQGQNEGFFWLGGAGHQAIMTAMRMEFRQQGIPQPNGQIVRNLLQNVNTQSLMVPGPWHRWEAVLIKNTMGQANGVFKMWIDGIMVMNYSDVTYVTPSTPNGFNLFKWNPTWGGSGGTRTRNDFIDIDHVYISGLP